MRAQIQKSMRNGAIPMQVRHMLLFTLAGIAAAADPAYVGKWKLNPDKSDFAGAAVTFARLPSGEWQSTSNGQTYRFKMPSLSSLSTKWSSAHFIPALFSRFWKFGAKEVL